jgi:hypothetical protein
MSPPRPDHPRRSPIRRWLGLAAILAPAVLLAIAAVTGWAATTHRHWWKPPAKPTWYWQLQGPIKTGIPASVYDVDGFGTSAAQVAQLHGEGKRVVCYIDVGTWENWRSDADQFPKSVLGNSDGWPGERWLDIRQLSVLEPIMTKRFQMCAHKHFDAIEPDNLDPLGNDSGFPITRAEVIRYARWVATEAHSLGLAVLQKNGPELVSALEPYFDGALDEQCNQYQECGSFAPYVRAGKPVLDAEYSSRLYPGFCATDRRLGFQGALYDLALNGKLYKPCWSVSGRGG